MVCRCCLRADSVPSSSGSHQARITDHVGREDSGELPVNAFFGHAAPFRSTQKCGSRWNAASHCGNYSTENFGPPERGHNSKWGVFLSRSHSHGTSMAA